MRKLRMLASREILATMVGLSLCLGTASPIQAYKPETHEEISDVAVIRSTLDGTLKSQYSVEGGIQERVAGQTIQRWIRIGANLEDVPSLRALNHFHNPLQPWPQAGLRVFGSQLGQSSVYWQQNPDQGRGGIWSWPVARSQFFESLILPNKGDRETALADTARALGQVMHMLQDATSPAHARNDPHPIADGYESRIEELRRTNLTRFNQLLSAPSVFPSPSIFTPTGDLQAPVPIARLIDTDQFEGLNSTVLTSNTIGMAEYTNGNFLSDDTIFLDFLLPRPQSLSLGFFVPEGQGQRQYFSKVGAGEQVNYFVAEGVWQERLLRSQSAEGNYILTDRVYQDYAAKLLPRAVGYSAALLDYFFRGKIDMVPNPANTDVYLVKNLSDEDMNGTFALYYDDANDNRVQVRDTNGVPVEWHTNGALAAQGQITATPFAPPTDPAPKTPGEYMLVFKGTMGEENLVNGSVGAVVAKKVTIQSSSFLTPAGRVIFSGGAWTLQPDSSLQYGNIDWRGSGNLSVSWHGGTTRAMNHLSLDKLDTKIYQGGALLAEAPGKVSGAALQKGADGTIYLIVVVSNFTEPAFGGNPYPTWTGTDTIYRKILPDGNWNQVGEFSYPEELTISFDQHVSLWHFNPEGTEAVSVKSGFHITNFQSMTQLFKMSMPVGGGVSVTAGSNNDAVQAADYTSNGELRTAIYNTNDFTLELPHFSINLAGTSILFLDMRYEVAIYMTLVGNGGGTVTVYLHTPQSQIAIDMFTASDQMYGATTPEQISSLSQHLPSTTTLYFATNEHPIHGIRPQLLWGLGYLADFGPVQLGEELYQTIHGGFFGSGVIPNMVWAMVNREGAVALGLRQFEGTQWEPGLGPLLVWGHNVNRIYNADLSFQEMPVNDPTGVVHPIGLE